jgi:hypothetical protein
VAGFYTNLTGGLFDAGPMADRLMQSLRFIAPLSTRAMTK